jgi:hypothetical protein
MQKNHKNESHQHAIRQQNEEDPTSILLRRNRLLSILRWRGQRERKAASERRSTREKQRERERERSTTIIYKPLVH